jgi:uncharacterized secreted protein with C-terminal beta-propeller domain
MFFLINNPVIAVVFLIAVGLSIVIFKKLVDEIKLNKLLRIKQKAMRINVKSAFNKRISGLGALTMAPVGVFVLFLAFAFNIEPDVDNNVVPTFASAQDILSIYEDFTEKMNSSYYRGGFFIVEDAMDMEMAPTTDGMLFGDDGSNAEDEGSDDFSGVNNQVDGVDELDNVITDGLYIYSIYGNEVQISKAYTESLGSDALELLHTITFNNNYQCDTEGSSYPIGLYYTEDHLVVITTDYHYDCMDGEPQYDYWGYFYDYNSTTTIRMYDKTDFSLDHETVFSGNFIGSRKIGNDIYLVTNTYIPFNNEELNLDEYLPYYEIQNQKVVTKYEDIKYVEGTTPNSFTSFYAYNVESQQVDMETVLGDSGYNLYVSEDNMYLAGSIYYFWPITAIADVEDPIYEHKTAIMRISIDHTSVEFTGVGYVEGNVENQFSMDEYNGNLRLTTTQGWWDVTNYLWILDEDLNVIGQLGGEDGSESLGKPGERIRATRFSGDYVYVVTFLQTDPFYVINLTDPANPYIEGELEISGYSEHIKVLSNDYVLGIGYEANDTGRVTGLKFAIYDVSDKSNPFESSNTTFTFDDFGYAYTSALWNHKDLLVSLDKGFMSMPFSSSGYDDDLNRWTYNSGIIMFDLSLEEGIGQHTFIMHEENAEFNCYVYKSLFISDQFYTVSNKYIKVSSIDDPTNFTNSITLREFSYQDNPDEDPEVLED